MIFLLLISAMTYRNDLSVYADMIKETVSARDVGIALGLDIRRNRCRCPIHGGHDYNCVLYSGNRGFYCHVCKAGGDVIKLVQQSMTGMQFPDVVRWFNSTFNMGMNIDSSDDKDLLKSAKKRLKRKADDRAFRERIEQLDFDMFLAIQTALERMEQQRDDNRPRRYGEDWNKAFCEAVASIPELHDALTFFAMESTVIRK